MKTQGPIKDAVELLDEEVARLDVETAKLREVLRGLLELVLAIQENNPALFLPSLNYNQRVMAAKDAILNTPSEGPSKTKLPEAPASGGGPMTRCEHCQGEGRLSRAAHGGNDPDSVDMGECPECHGSGKTSDWRPIETAPKDGTHILAASSSGFRYIVLWDEDRCHWVRQDNETACFPHNWQPLPAPPRRESVYSGKSS